MEGPEPPPRLGSDGMAPQAQPIVTVDEIDEAIWWVLMTAPRKLDYMRIVDALLDQRNAVSRNPQASGHPEQPDPQGQDAPRQGSTSPSRDHPAARPSR